MHTHIYTGWPPSQGSQGSQGKVREFICCLKKVKNGQGIKQKDAAKSGKKDEIGKMKKRSGNLLTVTSTTILESMYIFHPMCHIFLYKQIFVPVAAFYCFTYILLDCMIMKTIFFCFRRRSQWFEEMLKQ